jgi:hypothetical protein
MLRVSGSMLVPAGYRIGSLLDAIPATGIPGSLQSYLAIIIGAIPPSWRNVARSMTEKKATD